MTANAAAQATSLTTIDANLGTATTNITTLTANAAAQATTLTTLTANAATQQSNISTLLYDTGLNTADILTLQTYSANISGQIFNGNIQAENITANANITATGSLIVGAPSPIVYPNQAGVFTGNVDGYDQLVVQNTNSGAGASGDIVITADDGSDTANYLNIGVNSSNWSGNFIVPAGDTGTAEYAHDGYLTVIGGNAAVRTDGNVWFVANTSVAGLTKDGSFYVSTEITTNGDVFYNNGTSVTTSFGTLNANIGNIVSVTIPAIDANIGNIVSVTIPVLDANIGNIVSVTIPVLDANIGNISLGSVGYTMANYQNWTSNVSTVGNALDQLAERLKLLGG